MSSRSTRVLAALGLVLGTCLFVVVSPTPPASAAPDPVCAGGTCTVTFSPTGAPEEFVVPVGVTSLGATVAGGSGGLGHEDLIGGAPPRTGGDGGRVVATVPVTAGETLDVVVGGKGADADNGEEPENTVVPGGYGGGGDAIASLGGSDGAGGGGSFVFRGPDPLVISGGGGGGGYQDGGDGGAGGPGDSAQPGGPAGLGGGAGTTTGPGAGGANGGNPGTGPAVGPETFGVGGSPLTFCPGGAGGGGFYGGGSGGCAGIQYGGGGGGAGFLAAGVTSTSTSTSSGDGTVVLSWAQPVDEATSTSLTGSPERVETGEDATLTATVSSTSGTPSGSVTFEEEGVGPVGTVALTDGVAALTIPAGTTTGERIFVASYSGDTGWESSTSAPFTLTVTAEPTPDDPDSDPDPDTTTPPTDADGDGVLPDTGADDVTLLAALGLASLVGGVCLVAVGAPRRQRRA